MLAAIAAHRAAIAADEASFGEDGVAKDEALAEATGAAEIAALQALVAAPCVSAADVQAKVDYLLYGNVGMRSTMLDCLLDETYQIDGERPQIEILLASLVAGAPR